jgi:hypothetical protein
VENIDKILRRVEALLAKADSTDFPEEAKSFREKAEALMWQYRIEEATLRQAAPTGTLKPEWVDIVVSGFGEYQYIYSTMFGAVVQHFDCKAATTFDGAQRVAHVVGYPSDLRFIDALWQSIRLAFANRMEPKYNPEESDQVNAYRLRKAGLEGRRIAMMIYGSDDRSLRPKVRAMFKAESLKRGEDPTPLLGKGVNVKGYRASYAAAFEDEIWRRLYYMKHSRGEQEQGLILASRAEDINEAFWEKYPHLRPAPAGTPRIGNEQDGCPKCAKAKSGYCREHSYLKPRAPRYIKGNSAGLAAGREAARSVDLGTRGRLQP